MRFVERAVNPRPGRIQEKYQWVCGPGGFDDGGDSVLFAIDFHDEVVSGMLPDGGGLWV